MAKTVHIEQIWMQFLNYKKLWGQVLNFIMITSWVDIFQKLTFPSVSKNKKSLNTIKPNHNKTKVSWFFLTLKKWRDTLSLRFPIFLWRHSLIYCTKGKYVIKGRSFHHTSYWRKINCINMNNKKGSHETIIYFWCALSKKDASVRDW